MARGRNNPLGKKAKRIAKDAAAKVDPTIQRDLDQDDDPRVTGKDIFNRKRVATNTVSKLPKSPAPSNKTTLKTKPWEPTYGKKACEVAFYAGPTAWAGFIEKARKAYPRFQADLSNIDFRTVNASKMTFASGAFAMMEKFDLRGANLEGANFQDMLLDNIIGGFWLEGANLKNANFKDAELDGSLEGCNLQGANFAGTKTRGGMIPSHPSFKNADLTNANFVGARLGNCRFEDAKMDLVDFSEASFYSCDFTNASMKEATFAGTKFSEGIFKNNNLEKARFVSSPGLFGYRISGDDNEDQISFLDCKIEDTDFDKASALDGKIVFSNTEIIHCGFNNITLNADFVTPTNRFKNTSDVFDKRKYSILPVKMDRCGFKNTVLIGDHEHTLIANSNFDGCTVKGKWNGVFWNNTSMKNSVLAEATFEKCKGENTVNFEGSTPKNKIPKAGLRGMIQDLF